MNKTRLIYIDVTPLIPKVEEIVNEIVKREPYHRHKRILTEHIFTKIVVIHLNHYKLHRFSSQIDYLRYTTENLINTHIRAINRLSYTLPCVWSFLTDIPIDECVVNTMLVNDMLYVSFYTSSESEKKDNPIWTF